MPSYKMTYFNARARGEILRLLFAYGDIKYEDCRINISDWPKMKPTVPYQGGIPFMVIDGVEYSQTYPLVVYLAKQVGLAPDSPLDNLKAGMIYNQLAEMRFSITGTMATQKDETIKKQKVENFLANVMPQTLDRMEEMVNEHGYLVCDKLTYAEVMLMDTLETFALWGWDVKKWQKLGTLWRRIAAVPTLDKWRKERPETPI